jgi:hypothetical protein
MTQSLKLNALARSLTSTAEKAMLQKKEEGK